MTLILYYPSLKGFISLFLCNGSSQIGDLNLKRHIQWVPQLLERPEFFHVNKSCRIEYCGNNQIIQNMILSRGLELKLNASLL